MPGAWYDHGHTKFDLNFVKITKLCRVTQTLFKMGDQTEFGKVRHG